MNDNSVESTESQGKYKSRIKGYSGIFKTTHWLFPEYPGCGTEGNNCGNLVMKIKEKLDLRYFRYYYNNVDPKRHCKVLGKLRTLINSKLLN